MVDINEFEKNKRYVFDDLKTRIKEYHKKNSDGSREDVYYNNDGSTQVLTNTSGMALEINRDTYGDIISEDRVDEFGKKYIRFNPNHRLSPNFGK